MITDRGVPGGAGQRTPGEHGSNLGVRNDAAPTSINSLVTGKGGDDGFTLIWSRRRADLIRQDRRLAFASGPELALVTMRLSAVATGADHSARF
jgi:hypothetical protein